MITIIVFISFIIFILLFCVLFLIRNAKVCNFRIYILKMSYNHSEDYWNNINWDNKDWFIRYKIYETASSLYKQINDKYEYNEMLYSIKPLKLDKWFTEKEINFIKFGTLK